MNLNRRDFGKLALPATALAAPSLLSAKPRFGLWRRAGRRHYLQLPRYARRAYGLSMAMLKYITDANASGIEFMWVLTEAFAGSPAAAYAGAQGARVGGGRGMVMGRGGRGRQWRMQMTPERMAQMQAQRERNE